MKKKVPVEWIGGINIINWDEVPLMAPSKPYPLPVLQQIRSTKLVRISPDEKYEEDVKNGSLIPITNPKYNVTGTKRSQPNTHTMDGIFSPMFGQERPNDPQRFSCFCRSLTGVQNRGKIVSREEIMESLWDNESFIDDNTLTVNITRLRNKMEELVLKELIETKR